MLAIATLSLFGCSRPNELEPVPELVATEPHHIEEQPLTTGPIKVAVAIDLSGSIHSHRIALPQVKHLQPIFEILSKAGGELAIGLVCDDSNQPLARVRINEPPKIDLDVIAISSPPEAPDPNINPFDFVELQEAYLEELADYQEETAKIGQHLDEHDEALEQHQEQVANALSLAHKKIEPLLSQKADCQKTDLWGAVQRINIFLAEDNSNWSQAPQLYALFVTDGLDTQQNASARIVPQADVLIVNGSGSIGIFSELPHKSFESFFSALSYIRSDFLKGGANL